MDNRKKGVLCIVIATVLLSCGGVLIKSVDASSMTIAAVRGGIAGIVFIPFIQWKKLRFDKSFVGLILAYSFLTATFVTATKMTTAANAIILQCTAPLWLYLFYLVSSVFPDTPVLSYPFKYVTELCNPAAGIFGSCQKD